MTRFRLRPLAGVFFLLLLAGIAIAGWFGLDYFGNMRWPMPSSPPEADHGRYATSNRQPDISHNPQGSQNSVLGPPSPRQQPAHSGPATPKDDPLKTLTEVPDKTEGPVIHSSLDIFNAVKKQDVAWLKRLLADDPRLVELRNYRGATALHLAAILGNVQMVKLLLGAGAAVNDVCNSDFYTGQTALHLAAGQGRTAVVAELIRRGAKVNARDSSDAIPLHEAAIQGRLATAKLLLKKGALLDAKQKDGYTPLFWAIINNHADMVKLLLEKGADRNAKANDGTTPAQFAEMMGRTEIAKLLEEK